MDTSTTHFWNAKQSQIYTTLKALEEEQLIQSVIEEQQSRPDRRVYSLTDAGRAALNGWLNEPLAETEQVKSSLLLKLFFSARLDKETVIAQLRVHLGLHRSQVELYRAETRATIEAISSQNPALQRDAVMWEATRHFGEIYEELYVRWLEETITTFEKEL
jgi:DNA-binding PadR family transcriptional regulator